ncbi:beta-N-acetylhexosaminidase [Neisseriaceae bacterium ESL0693]|nr:beta-N-acetylhexosaminidase [Neisseriaceae bacterium ESL0693]
MTQASLPLSLPRGPIMADVAAYSLTDEEKQRLSHPAIGGVILFRRNYQSRDQIKALVEEIKALRTPELVVAVDHEGGRVQRFIAEFTRLPAMRTLGNYWDMAGSQKASALAEQVGWVLATELRSCGIDLSFTPVLDLEWQHEGVIGNRSFHRRAEIVSALAIALQRGLSKGGMASCGKHFPGHGFAHGDSHVTLPRDDRSLAALEAEDLQPFKALVAAGMASVMPAHVIYTRIDAAEPAGFSELWLKQILRQQMQFDGVIFSDDLTMEGASIAGDVCARAKRAFTAGCDIALVCNKPDWVDTLLADFCWPHNDQLARRWDMISGRGQPEKFEAMRWHDDFIQAQAQIAQLISAKDLAAGVPVGEAP